MWISNENIKRLFREYFDGIAEEVMLRLSRDPFTNEDTITENIMDVINDDEHGLTKDLMEGLKKHRLFIRIRANSHKTQENVSGVDLGIALDVRTSDYNVKKVILVQSKKLNKSGKKDYPELRKRGTGQAKKMLKLTPASFFFFYNNDSLLDNGPAEDLLRGHFVRNYKGLALERDESLMNWYPLRMLRKHFPFLGYGEIDNEIWKRKKEKYSGILVCPANTIASWKPIESTFERMLPASRSFSDFMVEQFLSCFVGDRRKQIVEKVIPSKEHDGSLVESSIEYKIVEE